MSKDDLKDLKRQRRETLKDLHLTYVHTKRDIKKAISPDRHIRRHLGVAIGLAAIAGMILAPAPSRPSYEKPASGKKRKSRGGGMLGSMLYPIITKLVPQAKQFLPDLDNAAEVEEYYEERPGMIGPPPPAHLRERQRAREQRSKQGGGHPLQPILLQLITTLMQRVDLQKIIAQVMKQFSGRKGEQNGRSNPKGPRMTVDDSGTVDSTTTPPTSTSAIPPSASP